MNNLTEIEQWLFGKHVKVNRDWLEACFHYLLEQLSNPSLSELKDAVYKQWITEDLRVMGCGSLPPRITKIHRIVLTGKYILQINSLRDISQPAYGQLLKNRDITGSDNLSVTAAPKEVESSWIAQPKRMLYMEITDGSQELHGMEYKPISQLTICTTPGIKLLVCGPIECRMGVLLLTSNSIQILGGHVESLAMTNVPENILNKALEDIQNVPKGVSESRSSNENVKHENQYLLKDCNMVSRTAQFASGITLSKNNYTSQQNNSLQTNINSKTIINKKRTFSNTDCDDLQNDNLDDYFNSIDVNEMDLEPEDWDSLEPADVHNQARSGDFITIKEEIVNEDDTFPDFNEEDTIETDLEAKKLLHSKLCNSANALTGMGNSATDWNSPFTFLSSLESKTFGTILSKAEHVIVKGFISTVTSQLKPHPTLGWQLSAKLNDGSLSIEVDLAHSFLTEVIGLSISDVMKMNAQAKTNPETKALILKSVNKCQKYLQNMNGLMELVLISPRPVLLKHIPFETEHLAFLAKRVTTFCSQRQFE